MRFARSLIAGLCLATAACANQPHVDGTSLIVVGHVVSSHDATIFMGDVAYDGPVYVFQSAGWPHVEYAVIGNARDCLPHDAKDRLYRVYLSWETGPYATHWYGSDTADWIAMKCVPVEAPAGK